MNRNQIDLLRSLLRMDIHKSQKNLARLQAAGHPLAPKIASRLAFEQSTLETLLTLRQTAPEPEPVTSPQTPETETGEHPFLP